MDNSQDLADSIEKLADVFEQEIRDAIDDLNYPRVFTIFAQMGEANKRLEAARQKFGKVYEIMNKADVPNLFEALGTDIFRVPEIGRSFYPNTMYSATILDKEAAFDWLRANGGGELIQPTVNAGTLKSFVRTKLDEEGVEPPDDVIKFSSYQVIGSSKYTPKVGQLT